MAILGAILAIGFLVLVHEAGHYFVARWCNMRVERFSIGFGPAVYSWPRREEVIAEQATGKDDIAAELFRLARKRPRGRAGIVIDGKHALEWSAAELAAEPLHQVHAKIQAVLAEAKTETAEVKAWEQVDFTLAPIPFGGFVQIDGMAIVEDVDPTDKRAYPNRPVWQRVATIFAGPATNYLTAVVLGIVLFSVAGVRSGVVEYTVEGFADGYDAKGKLELGDRIVEINDQRILRDATHGGLPAMIQEYKHRPIKVTVEREGQTLDIDILAKPDVPEGFWADLGRDYAAKFDKSLPVRYLIGIQMSEHAERVDVGIGGGLKEAFVYPVEKSEMILVSLWKIVSREEKGEVGGPVMITAMIKRSIDYGWIELFTLLMLLNVYLGLFNLLPLPALDGGRLAFLGYEIVTRRRPNPSVEQTVHAVGIMAFLVIMVLVTYKDILRLFS
ncbi:MAG: RIP metalloprotease [Deltaproteobacteria bacterium]|nr:RIP metalloprotease [Deltaproteobacteria bacterium]